MTVNVNDRAANFYIGAMNRRARSEDDTVAANKKALRKLNESGAGINTTCPDDERENSGKAEKAERDMFLSEEKTEKSMTSARDNELDEIYRQLEAAKQKGNSFDILAKCFRIAFRIMRGDNVPPKDDWFLRENNAELHFKAWLLRKNKEDPEDCESVLDEEEDAKYFPENNIDVSISSSSDVGLNMSIEALDISV